MECDVMYCDAMPCNVGIVDIEDEDEEDNGDYDYDYDGDDPTSIVWQAWPPLPDFSAGRGSQAKQKRLMQMAW